MKNYITYPLIIVITACGNPGGISDADYAKYKELGAPKILFSCAIPNFKSEDERSKLRIMFVEKAEACKEGDGTLEEKISCMKNIEEKALSALSEKLPPTIEVKYRAGVGIAATYNKILEDSKRACIGEFSILEKSE